MVNLLTILILMQRKKETAEFLQGSVNGKMGTTYNLQIDLAVTYIGGLEHDRFLFKKNYNFVLQFLQSKALQIKYQVCHN